VLQDPVKAACFSSLQCGCQLIVHLKACEASVEELAKTALLSLLMHNRFNGLLLQQVKGRCP
jgi:hypothetical protein